MKIFEKILNFESIKNSLFLLSGSSFLTSIRLISGLIILKIVATISGPAGIAIYGQVQNVVVMLNGITSSASGDGVIKLIAENQKNIIQKEKIAKSSLQVLLMIVFSITPILFIFKDSIVEWINVGEFTIFEIVIYIAGSIFAAIGTLFISIRNGMQEYKKVIKINILSILLALVFSILVLFILGEKSIIIIPAIYMLLIGLFQISFLLKESKYLNLIFTKIDKDIIKQLSGFMLIAFTSFVITPFVMISIRSIIISQYGFDIAGDWESSRRILELVTAILTAYFSMILLPKTSKLKNNGEIRNLIFLNAIYISLLSMLTLIFFYYFRHIIYTIIYTSEFNFSSDLLLSRAFGEFLRNLLWMFGLILVAKAKFKLYILMSIFSGILLLLLSNYLVFIYGVIGLNYAYLLNNLIMLIISFYIFMKITSSKDDLKINEML